MPKCKICKSIFTPKYSSLQSTCESPKCIIQYSELQKEKEWKRRKENMKFENISSDGYRAKKIQPIINEIARFIDYGCPCIATGRFDGKMAGGHFISVGSNRSSCLNLHNIHIQSFESNSFKSGDESRYRIGLINRYGEEYFKFVDKLRYLKNVDLSKERLKELLPTMVEIRNSLKANRKKYSPSERIQLRNDINEKIGIYYDIFID